MFRKLINDAKGAVGSVISKYAARASVAVPFVIGFGFGVAALAVYLVEEFGHRTGYLIMAGGFIAVGAIAAAVVRAKEAEEESVDDVRGDADTAEVVKDSAKQAATQVPAALAGLIFNSPAGPPTLRIVSKLALRNWPLVVMLTAIGLIMWSRQTADAAPLGPATAAASAGP